MWIVFSAAPALVNPASFSCIQTAIVKSVLESLCPGGLIFSFLPQLKGEHTHTQQAPTPTESNKRQYFYLSFSHLSLSLSPVCIFCVFYTAGDMS